MNSPPTRQRCCTHFQGTVLKWWQKKATASLVCCCEELCFILSRRSSTILFPFNAGSSNLQWGILPRVIHKWVAQNFPCQNYSADMWIILRSIWLKVTRFLHTDVTSCKSPRKHVRMFQNKAEQWTDRSSSTSCGRWQDAGCLEPARSMPSPGEPSPGRRGTTPFFPSPHQPFLFMPSTSKSRQG